MSEVRTFEDLEAWQACRAFRILVHRQILPFLLEKKEFDLCDQLKRSSRSTTNNIAEGYGRFHYIDNRKFCSISRGSRFESLDHIICANDEALISDSLLSSARDLFDHSLKLLNGYMAYLKRAGDPPNNQ
ncbi:MAG: four helix bundle protein [Verrucomicrobia bacterium]|nr:four helix bundle protein [Verrucomicrobiota bacterium]MDA1006129.1 four helix bundle protein [Verrucomicrobiota bacterium]